MVSAWGTIQECEKKGRITIAPETQNGVWRGES
ncbi:rCG23959 [Rattus norvegicus]|uniref:RCG23959 n=1 Tax=Rattus norvegicus TaxID=10116 RepID=A6JW53_RAT|nr:rCG23959 [Rattus norvegicus]